MALAPDADGKFPCSHCSKSFLHAKHLKRHLNTHNSPRGTPVSASLVEGMYTKPKDMLIKPLSESTAVVPETPTSVDDFQSQCSQMETAYAAYQAALGEVFQNITDGHLAQSSQPLLEMSEWLLRQVNDLGLEMDGEPQKTQERWQTTQLILNEYPEITERSEKDYGDMELNLLALQDWRKLVTLIVFPRSRGGNIIDWTNRTISRFLLLLGNFVRKFPHSVPLAMLRMVNPANSAPLGTQPKRDDYEIWMHIRSLFEDNWATVLALPVAFSIIQFFDKRVFKNEDRSALAACIMLILAVGLGYAGNANDCSAAQITLWSLFVLGLEACYIKPTLDKCALGRLWAASIVFSGVACAFGTAWLCVKDFEKEERYSDKYKFAACLTTPIIAPFTYICGAIYDFWNLLPAGGDRNHIEDAPAALAPPEPNPSPMNMIADIVEATGGLFTKGSPNGEVTAPALPEATPRDTNTINVNIVNTPPAVGVAAPSSTETPPSSPLTSSNNLNSIQLDASCHRPKIQKID